MTILSKQDLPPNGWIALVHDFVRNHAVLMATLLEGDLGTFGSRLVAYHGDAGAQYRYSGRTFHPRPWSPELAHVRDRIEEVVGARFNSVLLNYYPDGGASMGFHSDAEPELGPNAPDDVLIASVSLGAARRFVLQSKATKERRVIELGEGSILVMGGAVQRQWWHGVPKTARKVGPRLNLTFRIVRRLRSAADYSE